MTNNDWLNKMAQIDRLNILIKETPYCVLYLLGVHATTERCDKYYDERGLDQTCHNCLAHWLGEEHKREVKK